MPIGSGSFPPSALLAGLAAIAISGPAAAAITNAPPPATQTKVDVKTVAEGLVHPWGLQFLPDGRMLVTERPGRLRVVTREGKISEPIAGVPGVDARGQGGLLDVRLAPDYPQSSIIFLSFSEPREGGKNSTSVARGKLAFDGDVGRIEGLSFIFRQEPAADSTAHFGSRLVFARDGTLFITTGDRYILRAEAQNPANHVGKVVRINPNGTIPEGRETKETKEKWAPEVWSLGHRNIQGAAIHPATGKLWTVEHGARGGDELNIPEAGKNYGWPVISYGVDYSGAKLGEGTAKEGLEQPVYYWDPSIAVSNLAFHTGDGFPQWKDNLFVGGLEGTQIARLVLDGTQVTAEEKLLVDQGERIRDVRQGSDGALYVLTDGNNGKVLRVAPAQ